MPRPTDLHLRALAMKIAEGRVYGTWDVPANLWHVVFLPLLFLDKKQRAAAKRRKVAHFYGVIDEHKTTGRAVNGFPTFMECGQVTESEFKKLSKLVKAAQETRQTFLEKG